MVRGETGEVTYQELRERSAAFGGLLSELGVEPGPHRTLRGGECAHESPRRSLRPPASKLDTKACG
jgi:hypothetical protein